MLSMDEADLEGDIVPIAEHGNVIVYYWESISSIHHTERFNFVLQPSFGHIAIALMRYREAPLYISFWSGGCFSANQHHPNDSYVCRRKDAHFHNKDQDDCIYGDRVPQRIILRSLDIDAMQRQYEVFIGRDYQWRIWGSLFFVNGANKNCSGLTYDLINEGLGSTKVSVITRAKFAWKWHGVKTLPAMLLIAPVALYAGFVLLKRIKDKFMFNAIADVQKEVQSDSALHPLNLPMAFAQHQLVSYTSKGWLDYLGLLFNVIDAYTGNIGLVICLAFIALAASYVSHGTLGSVARVTAITPKDVNDYVKELKAVEDKPKPSLTHQIMYYSAVSIVGAASFWTLKKAFEFSGEFTSLSLKKR